LKLLAKNIERIKCARCGKVPKWIKGKKKKYCPECHVISFIETNCTHIKGKWAGVPFRFIPWQIEDVIVPAFGTLDENGYRQYRFVYIEVPKKNGKTELVAALSLYGLVGDGEEGGEIYSAAGDIGQASLVYGPAAQMVRNSKALSGRLKIIDSRRRIIDFKTNSFYQVLSAEAYTKHGLNPSIVGIDETHAHKSRELYDTLTEGTDTARSQQLVLITTTAGIHDENSIGWELHEYARQVKEGTIDDPTFLPVIWAAEKDADWEDPKVWRDCNPSIDHIFDIEKIEKHHNAVSHNPAKQNNFRRFRLNQWVSQVTRYIPMDHWRACDDPVDKGKLLGRQCFGGLDLSSKIDMSAFVLVFPPEGNEKWQVLPYYFMPEDTLMERAKEDRVPYDMWARGKSPLITTTPGNIIDYAFIEKQIVESANLYSLQEVAYDPWNATELATRLENTHGITMVEHRQGFKSMSEPTKKLHAHILEEKLQHGGHKTLTWNADNFEVRTDESENIRPVKSNKTKRIDGLVALIMGFGRAMQHHEQKSVYSERGVIVL
jgi:phage terminase large subunit-like protein